MSDESSQISFCKVLESSGWICFLDGGNIRSFARALPIAGVGLNRIPQNHTYFVHFPSSWIVGRLIWSWLLILLDNDVVLDCYDATENLRSETAGLTFAVQSATEHLFWRIRRNNLSIHSLWNTCLQMMVWGCLYHIAGWKETYCPAVLPELWAKDRRTEGKK